MVQQGRLVAAALGGGDAGIDEARVTQLLRQLGRRSEARLRIVDRDARVLGDSAVSEEAPCARAEGRFAPRHALRAGGRPRRRARPLPLPGRRRALEAGPLRSRALRPAFVRRPRTGLRPAPARRGRPRPPGLLRGDAPPEPGPALAHALQRHPRPDGRRRRLRRGRRLALHVPHPRGPLDGPPRRLSRLRRLGPRRRGPQPSRLGHHRPAARPSPRRSRRPPRPARPPAPLLPRLAAAGRDRRPHPGPPAADEPRRAAPGLRRVLLVGRRPRVPQPARRHPQRHGDARRGRRSRRAPPAPRHGRARGRAARPPPRRRARDLAHRRGARDRAARPRRSRSAPAAARPGRRSAARKRRDREPRRASRPAPRPRRAGDGSSQAFENLLANAVSFSPPGATVAVTARQEGATVVVDVDDSGPGIPPEHRERVFDRFFTSRPPGGDEPHDGLGLAIVRALVEGYGGSVAASDRPGGGARLTVKLPVAKV